MDSLLTKSTVKQKNSLFESPDLLRNHRKHGNQEMRNLQTDQQNLQLKEDWGRYSEEYT